MPQELKMVGLPKAAMDHMSTTAKAQLTEHAPHIITSPPEPPPPPPAKKVCTSLMAHLVQVGTITARRLTTCGSVMQEKQTTSFSTLVFRQTGL